MELRVASTSSLKSPLISVGVAVSVAPSAGSDASSSECAAARPGSRTRARSASEEHRGSGSSWSHARESSRKRSAAAPDLPRGTNRDRYRIPVSYGTTVATHADGAPPTSTTKAEGVPIRPSDRLRLHGERATAGDGDQERPVGGGRGAGDLGAGAVADDDHRAGDGPLGAGRVGRVLDDGAGRAGQCPTDDPRPTVRGDRHRRRPWHHAPGAVVGAARAVGKRIAALVDQGHHAGSVDVVRPRVAADASRLAVAPALGDHHAPPDRRGRHLVPGRLADQVGVEGADLGEPGVRGQDLRDGLLLRSAHAARGRRRRWQWRRGPGHCRPGTACGAAAGDEEGDREDSAQRSTRGGHGVARRSFMAPRRYSSRARFR